MSTATIAELIDDARRGQWCTKRSCSTCDATEWRSGVEQLSHDGRLAEQLAALPLHAWYDLPEFGGGIYHCFAALADRAAVDPVLDRWLTTLEGHYRIADAVSFYVIREGRASERMRRAWLSRSESMALESNDPSLLESLLYAFAGEIGEHTALHRAAERARRGHAPLDRALKRTDASATREPTG